MGELNEPAIQRILQVAAVHQEIDTLNVPFSRIFGCVLIKRAMYPTCFCLEKTYARISSRYRRSATISGKDLSLEDLTAGGFFKPERMFEEIGTISLFRVTVIKKPPEGRDSPVTEARDNITFL